MAEQSILDIVNDLPKPETLEEQYMYALVCSVAGVTPKYGIATNADFKRLDKLWKAFWLVAAQKFKDLETPAADTVNSAAIQNDAIVTNKLADEAVTLGKIDADVQNRLWGVNRSGEVTESMLHNDAVSTNKIVDGAVTTQKIADGAVTSDKIANGSITYNMLDSFLKGKIDNRDDGLL